MTLTQMRMRMRMRAWTRTRTWRDEEWGMGMGRVRVKWGGCHISPDAALARTEEIRGRDRATRTEMRRANGKWGYAYAYAYTGGFVYGGAKKGRGGVKEEGDVRKG